jgi:hypothetical protein
VGGQRGVHAGAPADPASACLSGARHAAASVAVSHP